MSHFLRSAVLCIVAASIAIASDSITKSIIIGGRPMNLVIATDRLIVDSKPDDKVLLAIPEGAIATASGSNGRTRKQYIVNASGGVTIAVLARQIRVTAPSMRIYAVAWDADVQDRNDGNRILISRSLIVKLKDGENPDAVLRDNNCDATSKRTILPNTYAADIIMDSPIDTVAVCGRLSKDPRVVWVQPNWLRPIQTEYTPNDPLLGFQWHLNNDGTVTGAATTGNDIRAASAWNIADGTGVNIGIVDDGVETSHPDLSPNVMSTLDYDFADGDTDSNPGLTTDSHGTFVAGIAAARGDNGIGGCGVAYKAGLIAIRLDYTALSIIQSLTFRSDEALTANQVAASNNSYGTPGDGKSEQTEDPAILDAYVYGTTNGRSGRGIVYVVSAGNNHEVYNPSPPFDFVGPDNVCYDGGRNVRHALSVGAVRADGLKASYSETGCALALCAPGGDTVGSPYRMVSVDRQGANGYNTTGDYTAFASGDHVGTSFAAPVVTGVSALMLQARPSLNWRDVQMILMRTARKNDLGDGNWWTTGAGLHYNVNYGFGVVDAGSAVTTAQTWTLLPSELSTIPATVSGSYAILDNMALSVPVTISAPSDFRVEAVEFTVSLTHPYPGDLTIELLSPSGMPAIVPRRDGDDSPNLTSWKFLSRAHLGEPASGTWTLRVTDNATNDQGTLTSVRVVAYGYRPYQVPAITSVSPAVVSTGSGNTVVTLDVTNLALSATNDVMTTVTVGGTNYAATKTGATTIQVTVPAIKFALAGTLTVTVTNPNILGSGGGAGSSTIEVNTAPIANDGPLAVIEDTGTTGTLVATDANGDALTYAVLAQGSKGTAVVTNASTGSFSYTPVADATGTDTFTFRAIDIFGSPSSAGVISVTISAVNDAPILDDLSLTVFASNSTNGLIAGFDIDSGSLSYSIISGPDTTKGTFTLNPATGEYTYQSTGTASTIDTVIIEVSDGALTSQATITVSIIHSGGGGGTNDAGGGGGCSAGSVAALLALFLCCFARQRHVSSGIRGKDL